MAKVVNNFVVDHVLRGIMVNKKGEYMWSINQITNPSLNVSLSDTAQAVDALGTPIAEFDRGRSAEFGAENSLFDLSLYAAQMGRDVEIASGAKKIVVPTFEEIADYVCENVKEGDLVITLGCGDVYKAAKMIIKKLEEK